MKILLLITLLTAFADGPSPQSLYDQGKFAEALAAWSAAPQKTAAEYYNMGNSHFRLGAMGQALAHYEKALSLLPDGAPQRDDVIYNLDLAASRLRDSGALAEDRSPWTRWVIPLARRAPAAAPWALSALLAAMAGFSLLRSYRSKTPLRIAATKASFLASALLALALGAAAAARDFAATQPLAVVAAESTTARSGPGNSFTELFHLNAGAKVRPDDGHRDGWVQIRYSVGNVGWVLEKDLLRL